MTAAQRRKSRLETARAFYPGHSPREWTWVLSHMAVPGGGFQCPRCRGLFDSLHKDHIIPLHKGGTDTIENIQPLCRRCNLSKRGESINWLAMAVGERWLRDSNPHNDGMKKYVESFGYEWEADNAR